MDFSVNTKLQCQLPQQDQWNLSELILLTEKTAALEERIRAENTDINIPNAYLINKDPYTNVKLPLLSASDDDSTDSDDSEEGADTSQKVPPVTPATAKKADVGNASPTKDQNFEENNLKSFLKSLASTLSPKHLRRFPALRGGGKHNRTTAQLKQQHKQNVSSSAKPRPLHLYTLDSLSGLELCHENENEVLHNYLYGEADTLNFAPAFTETEIYKEDPAAAGSFVQINRIKSSKAQNSFKYGNSRCWLSKELSKNRNLWGNPYLPSGSSLFSHVELQKTEIPPLKSKTPVVTSNFGSQFPPLISANERNLHENQADIQNEVEHVYDGIHIRDIGKHCLQHPLHRDCSSRIIAISKHGIVSTDGSTGSSKCYLEPLIRPKPVTMEPAPPKNGSDSEEEKNSPKSERKSGPVVIKSSGELAQHLSQFTRQREQGQERDNDSSSQDESEQERIKRLRRQRRRTNRQSKRDKTVEVIPSRTEIVQSINEPITFNRPGFSMANFLTLTPVQRLKYMRESFKNSQMTNRS